MNERGLRWSELTPEPGIVDALQYAGDRAEVKKKRQDDKRHWSERFADGCALAIARQLRDSKELKGKEISPYALGIGTERLVPLGSGDAKRIDVTVTDAVLGLEIGVSLKGLNFRDKRSNNFDKNLTGRLYELADEVRFVHERLPHAFMAGVFFLPLNSVDDKKIGESSFARAVLKLRERTGRLDPTLPAQAARCDCGFVALYTTGSEGFPAGLTRFMNVLSDPPRRGRPRISDTLSLKEAVEVIVSTATHSADRHWGDPEPD